MNAATFDTLTDWIGIPLVLIAAVLLMAGDLAVINGRTLPTLVRRSGQIMVVAVGIIILVRFIRLV